VINGVIIPTTSCLYGGFLKWWYLQIIHFHRIFHYKPTSLGIPHLCKPPYIIKNTSEHHGSNPPWHPDIVSTADTPEGYHNGVEAGRKATQCRNVDVEKTIVDPFPNEKPWVFHIDGSVYPRATNITWGFNMIQQDMMGIYAGCNQHTTSWI
jgi:hypothetical protein